MKKSTTDSKYASDPESASVSASASEDEGGDSDEGQTPKKDTMDKVKSLLGFGEEDSDNPSPKASDSETETEGDGSEGEGEDEGEGEGEGEAEEKPNLKSGFSKLLGSLKSAVKGMGSEGASAASEVEKINVGNPSSRKGKSGAAGAAAASSRKKKSRGVQPTQEEIEYNSEEGEEDEDGNGGSDNDDDGESKLKKFDKELRNDYLVNFHPESLIQNYDEIYNLARVVRDPNGVIVDTLHKTLPMLTKYEKTRILGQRAKQINNGATPFIKVPEGIIDGYLIALKELEEKKIPFIIRRPLPNRGSEYWHIEDLEIVI
jgi:DNA-directed RNA polymerase I, II, and III subunit RPABC2